MKRQDHRAAVRWNLCRRLWLPWTLRNCFPHVRKEVRVDSDNDVSALNIHMLRLGQLKSPINKTGPRREAILTHGASEFGDSRTFERGHTLTGVDLKCLSPSGKSQRVQTINLCGECGCPDDRDVTKTPKGGLQIKNHRYTQ